MEMAKKNTTKIKVNGKRYNCNEPLYIDKMYDDLSEEGIKKLKEYNATEKYKIFERAYLNHQKSSVVKKKNSLSVCNKLLHDFNEEVRLTKNLKKHDLDVITDTIDSLKIKVAEVREKNMEIERLFEVINKFEEEHGIIEYNKLIKEKTVYDLTKLPKIKKTYAELEDADAENRFNKSTSELKSKLRVRMENTNNKKIQKQNLIALKFALDNQKFPSEKSLVLMEQIRAINKKTSEASDEGEELKLTVEEKMKDVNEKNILVFSKLESSNELKNSLNTETEKTYEDVLEA